MISYAYWQSHFGGDPRVLGQTVRVLGGPLTDRRCAAAGLPLSRTRRISGMPVQCPRRAHDPRGARNLPRCRPAQTRRFPRTGASRDDFHRPRLEQQYPETNKGQSVAVARMRDDMVGDVRLTLYLLLGAVSVVLLIACANTATLLLGKATARTREIAVRVAMGASRRRIVRQLVTESLLLAFLAGAAGLLLAYWGSKALVALAPADLPRLAETGIDRSVLAFTLGISMITSLLFGLVPALYASKVDLNEALKQGGTRSVTGGGMVRMRGVLVVAEIALAVVLLSGAGLLIKSFVALHNVALGFRPENVLVMKATSWGPRRRHASGEPVLQRCALSNCRFYPACWQPARRMAPPGHVESTVGYFIDHLPAQTDWTRAPSAVLSIVAPGTFAALGIPLKSGRDFNDGDTSDKPFVAVVNEALVRKSLPRREPHRQDDLLSLRFLQGHDDHWRCRRRAAVRPGPRPDAGVLHATTSSTQFNGTTLSIVARTAGDPTALAETLRRLARERSPDVPLKFTTMEAMLSGECGYAPISHSVVCGFRGIGSMSRHGWSLWRDGVRRGPTVERDRPADRLGRQHGFRASAHPRARAGPRGRRFSGGLGRRSCRHAVAYEHAVSGTAERSPGLSGRCGSAGSRDAVASYVPARRASSIDPLTALRQE